MTKQIAIKGDIVDDQTAVFYELFGMSAVSPSYVSSILGDDDEDVVVNIASNGGDVFSASEIYTMLRNHGGNVVVNIQGLAASAASVIAMAGDTVKISPTAQIMIHKAWSQPAGNSDDLEQESKILSGIDSSIAAAYESKTGMDKATLLQLMANETWLTATDAVDKGFADEVMFVDESQHTVVNSVSNIPSKKAVNKFMNLLSKQNKKSESQLKDEHSKALLNQKLAILMQK